MPEHPDPVRERYCQFRSSGMHKGPAWTSARGDVEMAPGSASATATRVEGESLVQLRIKEIQDETHSDLRLIRIQQADYLFRKLYEVLEDTTQEIPIYTPSGRETDQTRMLNPMAALKAIETAGKPMGLFPTTANVRTGLLDPFEGKSSDEILEMYQEAARVIEIRRKESEVIELVRSPDRDESGGCSEDTEGSGEQEARLLPAISEAEAVP